MCNKSDLATQCDPHYEAFQFRLAQRLLSAPYEWRERRVERITQVHEALFQDRISLQFRIPYEMISEAARGLHIPENIRVLVPLLTFPKEQLVDTDITVDERTVTLAERRRDALVAAWHVVDTLPVDIDFDTTAINSIFRISAATAYDTSKLSKEQDGLVVWDRLLQSYEELGFTNGLAADYQQLRHLKFWSKSFEQATTQLGFYEDHWHACVEIVTSPHVTHLAKFHHSVETIPDETSGQIIPVMKLRTLYTLDMEDARSTHVIIESPEASHIRIQPIVENLVPFSKRGPGFRALVAKELEEITVSPNIEVSASPNSYSFYCFVAPDIGPTNSLFQVEMEYRPRRRIQLITRFTAAVSGLFALSALIEPVCISRLFGSLFSLEFRNECHVAMPRLASRLPAVSFLPAVLLGFIATRDPVGLMARLLRGPRVIITASLAVAVVDLWVSVTWPL